MGTFITIAIVAFIVLAISGAGKSKQQEEMLEKQKEAQAQIDAAEQAIMESGDKDLINQLLLAKASGQTQAQSLQTVHQSNPGHSIFANVLSIGGGIALGNLISSTIWSYQMDGVIEDMSAELTAASEEAGSFFDSFEI